MLRDRPLKHKQMKDLEQQKKNKDLSSKAKTRRLTRINKKKPAPSPWLNLYPNAPIPPLSAIKKGDSVGVRVPPEVEAFCGDLARIIIGIHQPKYRAVDNDSVMTKEIKGFRTFEKLSLDELNTLVNQAARNGFIAALVLTFYLSDIDGNSGNFGMNADSKIVRIDFECALHAYRREMRYGTAAAAKWWTITPDDLNHFFLMLGCAAFNNESIIEKGFEWKRDFNRGESEQDHPAYDRDKFKYLLKIILVNRSILEVLAKDHLSEENRVLVDHLESRRQALANTLPKMENFQSALAANQETYWSELEAEFKEYNQEQSRHVQKFENYLAAIEQKDAAQLKLIDSNPKYTGKPSSELKEIFTQRLAEYRGRLINLDELKSSYDNMVERNVKVRYSR
jgi:hypothetical protein